MAGVATRTAAANEMATAANLLIGHSPMSPKSFDRSVVDKTRVEDQLYDR
jgi:hypothetical protein